MLNKWIKTLPTSTCQPIRLLDPGCSHTDWQTVQIQISWLKPTDLDLHCLHRQGISGTSRSRVYIKVSVCYRLGVTSVILPGVFHKIFYFCCWSEVGMLHWDCYVSTCLMPIGLFFLARTHVIQLSIWMARDYTLGLSKRLKHIIFLYQNIIGCFFFMKCFSSCQSLIK